jgi:hypothetical protein
VPHGDALAVEAEHEQVRRVFSGDGARCVKGFEVLRGPSSELFHLPLRDRRPRGPAQPLDDLIERAGGRRLGCAAPDAMRVQLVRQAQRCVHRVQSRDPGGLIGEPWHLDLSDHRHQRTCAAASVLAGNAIGAQHLHGPLVRRPKLEVSLQQQPLVFAPLLLDKRLELGVRARH